MKINFTIKTMTRIAMVAAVYVTLTWLFSSLSYESVQLRLAEMLILLAFYRREYGIGVIIGCAIANLNSTIPLAYEMTLGLLSTIIPVILIWYTKKLAVAVLWPIIFVGALVGLEISIVYEAPLLIMILQVAIGEAIVMVIGYCVFKKLEENKGFLRIIGAQEKDYSKKPLYQMVGGMALAMSMIMIAVFFALPILQYSDPNGDIVMFSIYQKLSSDYSLCLGTILIVLPLCSGLLLLFYHQKIVGSIIGIIFSIIPIVYLLFLSLSIEASYVFLMLILLILLNCFLLTYCCKQQANRNKQEIL